MVLLVPQQSYFGSYYRVFHRWATDKIYSKILVLNTSKESGKNYNSQKLWISVKRGVFEGLEANEILYVQAADHYLKININKRKLCVIKSSLKDFHEQYLSRYNMFYRLSRSYVVNLNKAQKIENNLLYLQGNTILPIPKNKREEILKLVGAKQ